MNTTQAQPSRAAGRPTQRLAPGMQRWFVATEVLVVVVALALVALVVLHPGPLPGDVAITLAWQHLILPHPLLAAAIEADSTINWPVPAMITVAVFVIGCALARRGLDIAIGLGTMFAASGTNFLTSHLVRRPRPDGYGIVVAQQIGDTFSFPSGHVQHAVAFLGIVLFLTFQVRPVPTWVATLLWLVRAALLIQIVLMPFSRALEGEHWPSDILAGFLYGFFWLLVGMRLYAWVIECWPGAIPPNERRGNPAA